jgi:hypothetical protein
MVKLIDRSQFFVAKRSHSGALVTTSEPGIQIDRLYLDSGAGSVEPSRNDEKLIHRVKVPGGGADGHGAVFELCAGAGHGAGEAVGCVC